MGKRRHMPPFEVEIQTLGKGGTGVGLAPDGHEVRVKPAPPGSRVLVVPTGRKKGVWLARRLTLIRPAADAAVPRCAAFGVCGGCVLQELSLDGQRRAKQEQALAEVAEGMGLSVQALRAQAAVHAVRGHADAYGYRNKVELSFGTARFLAEDAHRAGEPIDGRWLGFHAPGRFDRVADAARCELISESANNLLATLRDAVLGDETQTLWNVRTHTGGWRHALLREGFNTGELLVALYTTSEVDEIAVARVAQALRETDLPGGRRLTGVVWMVNDGVADVARGEVRATWGQGWMSERLGRVRFQLSPSSFFQTSTVGAEVLYDTVGEALGARCTTLLDLYCGIGSIGLYLADHADHIVGIEEVEASVVDARANAAALGVSAEYRAARMEQALDVLDGELDDAVVVVDPPRVGLHPAVARKLSKLGGNRLVYVACKASSLGRDAAILADGGWRLVALWTVDLFPQTGHVELVARFERDPEFKPSA